MFQDVLMYYNLYIFNLILCLSSIYTFALNRIVGYAPLNYKSIRVHILYIPIKNGGYVKMSNKTHLSIRIDKELLKELKIIAIQQDTSVTGILLDFIQKYVEENKK